MPKDTKKKKVPLKERGTFGKIAKSLKDSADKAKQARKNKSGY